MISEPLSDQDIKDAFDRFIKNPSGGIPSDCGFDSKTEAALFGVMMNPNPITIADARKELGLQLNGTHAKEDMADIETMLEQARRKKQS